MTPASLRELPHKEGREKQHAPPPSPQNSIAQIGRPNRHTESLHTASAERRHTHATELINSGVSIEAVRRRLGHASTETTQLYALLDDKVADAEIRAARRRRDQAAR